MSWGKKRVASGENSIIEGSIAIVY